MIQFTVVCVFDMLLKLEFDVHFQEWYQSALKELESKVKHYTPLICEKRKPVPLKQYTPKIMKV